MKLETIGAGYLLYNGTEQNDTAVYSSFPRDCHRVRFSSSFGTVEKKRKEKGRLPPHSSMLAADQRRVLGKAPLQTRSAAGATGTSAPMPSDHARRPPVLASTSWRALSFVPACAGLYDGKGGHFTPAGGEVPPSDCDNFWLYVPAHPEPEPEPAEPAEVLAPAAAVMTLDLVCTTCSAGLSTMAEVRERVAWVDH